MVTVLPREWRTVYVYGMVLAILCGPPHLALAHPLHTTLTEMTYDANRRTVHVMIRVFSDDFGTAVARATHVHVASGLVWMTAAQSYVLRTFTVTDASGRSLALHHCGITRTGNLLWVCATVVAPNGIGTLRVRNGMLCDLYSDQVNIVQSNDRGTKRSVLFTRGDGAKPLR